MRIISGKLKGRSINYLKNETTRPLKDSVKENIFNILLHSNLIEIKIENANILDLYSGIGSFGLECISRGAKKVTFVEQDSNAINVLKENLNKLLINNQASIINGKSEDMLNGKKDTKYNIFFFDPPFSDNEFVNSILLIKKNNIYQKKHIIVIHRDSSSNDLLDNYLKTLVIKQYGRSKIIFAIFK
jgi:16S rRNA (guanine966-N2)-methyltransferase